MIQTETQNEVLHFARVYRKQGWPLHDAVLLAADHVAPYGHEDYQSPDNGRAAFWR